LHRAESRPDAASTRAAGSWGPAANVSVVAGHDPLRLVITASGISKGDLTVDQLLEIDGTGEPLRTAQQRADVPWPRSSAEARLHLEIVRLRGAGAVLHTHSMWSTLLSDLHACRQGL
jgi:methylthioribulose-1-phosphate dehydratase